MLCLISAPLKHRGMSTTCQRTGLLSKILEALSFSMLLPFTTALFFTPLLGPYQEPLTRDACYTFIGLFIVLLGFAVYQLRGRLFGA